MAIEFEVKKEVDEGRPVFGLSSKASEEFPEERQLILDCITRNCIELSIRVGGTHPAIVQLSEIAENLGQIPTNGSGDSRTTEACKFGEEGLIYLSAALSRGVGKNGNADSGAHQNVLALRDRLVDYIPDPAMQDAVKDGSFFSRMRLLNGNVAII